MFSFKTPKPTDEVGLVSQAQEPHPQFSFPEGLPPPAGDTCDRDGARGSASPRIVTPLDPSTTPKMPNRLVTLGTVLAFFLGLSSGSGGFTFHRVVAFRDVYFLALPTWRCPGPFRISTSSEAAQADSSSRLLASQPLPEYRSADLDSRHPVPSRMLPSRLGVGLLPFFELSTFPATRPPSELIRDQLPTLLRDCFRIMVSYLRDSRLFWYAPYFWPEWSQRTLFYDVTYISASTGFLCFSMFSADVRFPFVNSFFAGAWCPPSKREYGRCSHFCFFRE